jgi:hypothetical protein
MPYHLRRHNLSGWVCLLSFALHLTGTLCPALFNARGDVVAQSDDSAVVSWTASYEAFDRRAEETGDNDEKQRANTKDEDPTGLLNEGSRYRDLEAFAMRHLPGILGTHFEKQIVGKTVSEWCQSATG